MKNNTTITTKILAQFLIAEISSIIFGILFAMEGAEYNGKFMVTHFMGNEGWQAGALFYGLIGISLGALIGAVLATKIFKTKCSFFAGILMSLLIYSINMIPEDQGIPLLAGLQLYFFPALAATIGTNWYLIKSKLKIK